jgi:hypothetical protein
MNAAAVRRKFETSRRREVLSFTHIAPRLLRKTKRHTFGVDASKKYFFKGAGMGTLIVGGILFGMILGQFFISFVLFPAYALAVVLVLANPAHMDGFLGWLVQFAVLTASLQIGYLVRLGARYFDRASERSEDLSLHGPDDTPSSRTKARKNGGRAA